MRKIRTYTRSLRILVSLQGALGMTLGSLQPPSAVAITCSFNTGSPSGIAGTPFSLSCNCDGAGEVGPANFTNDPGTDSTTNTSYPAEGNPCGPTGWYTYP